MRDAPFFFYIKYIFAYPKNYDKSLKWFNYFPNNFMDILSDLWSYLVCFKFHSIKSLIESFINV